jgi:predicted RNA-binding Zn ribbon-like protein
MSETASGRYRIDPAPEGLALVHDLLNTVSAGRPRQPDLLDSVDLAQHWLDAAADQWSARTQIAAPDGLQLTARELAKLRSLRGRLRDLVAGLSPDGPALDSAVTVRLADDGTVTRQPRGQGAQWVISAVLGEIWLAQLRRDWQRLKICHNERCGTAFFDRSRNNSGVWHDVQVCGNAINLRASRARRRQEAGNSASGRKQDD